MFIKQLAVSIASVLLALPAISEPVPEIRRLMDEPVTMFDRGIDRLESWLEWRLPDEAAKSGLILEEHAITVAYAPAQDYIDVTATLRDNQKSPKDVCRKLLDVMRNVLVHKGRAKNSYPWLIDFHHRSDYSDRDHYADLEEQLPVRIQIQALVPVVPRPEYKFLMCQSDIFFKNVVTYID